MSTEKSVSNYRDILVVVYAIFNFSCGLSLRGITNNENPKIFTVIFSLILIAYIFYKHGIKNVNEIRNTASIEGIVTLEQLEKIKEAKVELSKIERIEKVDCFGIILMTLSVVFLVTA